jgi:hypothetical protein
MDACHTYYTLVRRAWQRGDPVAQAPGYPYETKPAGGGLGDPAGPIQRIFNTSLVMIGGKRGICAAGQPEGTRGVSRRRTRGEQPL